jgi:hypothetical protein
MPSTTGRRTIAPRGIDAPTLELLDDSADGEPADDRSRASGRRRMDRVLRQENAPAVVDVVTSQDAVSSDATKGLGFVPDYQALTPWNGAELARRR